MSVWGGGVRSFGMNNPDRIHFLQAFLVLLTLSIRFSQCEYSIHWMFSVTGCDFLDFSDESSVYLVTVICYCVTHHSNISWLKRTSHVIRSWFYRSAFWAGLGLVGLVPLWLAVPCAAAASCWLPALGGLRWPHSHSWRLAGCQLGCLSSPPRGLSSRPAWTCSHGRNIHERPQKLLAS